MSTSLGALVRTAALVGLAVAVGLAGALPAASLLPLPEPARARAGVAVVDASWNVGAASGQYASGAIGAHGIDPYVHATRKAASYGLQSRISVRALVVEGADGARVGVVANDLYLPQDLLNRRVAGLLELHDRQVALGLRDGPATGVAESHLAITASHSHGSPYYSTPSFGVWAFQDVMDVRFFEYMAERMAQAVIEAAADLRPVRMGGTTVAFNEITSHSYGPRIADDGTPAGQPWDFTTGRFSVLRFDDISAGDPSPLATWVIFAMHPEFSNGDDLVSGEFNHAVYRILDREIGGVTLMSQSEVGTAGPHKDVRVHGPETRHEFQDMGFSQMDRAARILADAVHTGYADIEAGTPEDPNAYAAFADDFTVDAVSHRFAPPTTRPYPGVSNCRTEKAFQGNPGVPVAGLPDCVFPFGGALGPVAEAAGTHELYEQLKEAGVPVPESYSPPAYLGLEETVAVHLQAMRIGDVALTFCPCEQFTDQALNIVSRLNRVEGDLWFGFDWTREQPCTQNADTTWTCPDPRNPARSLDPVPHRAYQRMLAQIYNDATGWDDLAYAPYAEAEPHDPAQIKGNFTHEELTGHGYGLVVPVGTANDYWGYVPSYREYMAWDHYRKALSGLGPHGMDWLATRLTRMAASLNGGPPVELDPLSVAYQAEGAQMRARANAFGTLSAAYRAAYEATLPDDGGSPRVVTQPEGIRRFDAATMTFVGGSNYTDLPEVRVERFVDGEWTPYGDTTGEVQVFLAFPQGAEDVAAWRAGVFEWMWTATFEAFNSDVPLPDASGVVRTQTPAGTYRLVAEGEHRGSGPYRLESETFAVEPWDGITVSDLRAEPDGSVSFALGPVSTYTVEARGLERTFVVGPVDYPDTYASPYRYFRGGRRLYHYNLDDPKRWQQFCNRCTFRPWADTAEVVSATLTVERQGAAAEEVEAVFADGRWWADAALGPGDVAYIDSGGIVDAFGEVNGEPSATLQG